MAAGDGAVAAREATTTMIVALLLWSMAEVFIVPEPLVAAIPVPGATNIPLNVEPLIPSPRFGAEPVVMLDNNDVEVAMTTSVQPVLYNCGDDAVTSNVVRLQPIVALLPQTTYRVITNITFADGGVAEVTSFTTGDDEDFDAPLPPTADPANGIPFECGNRIPVGTEPQSVVIATARDGNWIGFSENGYIDLHGDDEPATFSLVAVDAAGNFSAPQLVEVNFPPVNSCGCQQRRGEAPPWLAVMAMMVWASRRRP